MYKKTTGAKKSGIFLAVLEAFAYLFIVNGSYLLMMYFDADGKYTERNFDAYRSIWIYITITALGIFLFNRMFKTMKLSKIENILVVVNTTIMIALGVTAIAFVGRSFAMPRSIILQGFFVQLGLFVIIKLVMKSMYDKCKKEKNIILLCPLDETEEVIQELFGSRNSGRKEKLLFVMEECNKALDKLEDIQKVYIYDVKDDKNLEKFIHSCILKGIQVCKVPKSYELAMTSSALYLSSDVPLIKINQVGISLEYRFVKRTIDILFSLAGIIVLSPLFILVTLAIYFGDDKQILLRQKRVTVNNKEFTLYKFRTMVVDAEKYTGAVWATENDPRITKVGNVLRKYWLDELPQLFNVLKGDMSIVGPRPERPELIKEFEKDIPDFRMRTMVKCGLTGYAQVMAKYDTSPKNKLKFDLVYILNANLMLDISIMLTTGKKMLIRFLAQEKSYATYNEILDEWCVGSVDVTEDGLVFRYMEECSEQGMLVSVG